MDRVNIYSYIILLYTSFKVIIRRVKVWIFEIKRKIIVKIAMIGFILTLMSLILSFFGVIPVIPYIYDNFLSEPDFKIDVVPYGDTAVQGDKLLTRIYIYMVILDITVPFGLIL